MPIEVVIVLTVTLTLGSAFLLWQWWTGQLKDERQTEYDCGYTTLGTTRKGATGPKEPS